MTKRQKVSLALSLPIVALAVVWLRGTRVQMTDSRAVEVLPSIFPDYDGVDVPPNIAPLHFTIRERGDAFHVVLKGDTGGELVADSSKPSIELPLRSWRRFLAACAGAGFSVEVSARQARGWVTFKPFHISVEREPIDPYLVYRLIYPLYEWWSEMGIYQRDLESFDQTPILTNDSIDHACVNCHSFAQNDPTTMTLQLRKAHNGTLIARGDRVEKVDTRNDFTAGAAVYPAWHPSGTAIAFSVNLVSQSFPSSPTWHIEVLDKGSDLVLYDVDSRTISTTPALSGPEFENLPAWAPDGKHLYFTRADRPRGPKYAINDPTGSIAIEESEEKWIPDPADVYGGGLENAWIKDVKDLKYDLMRVSYDRDTKSWGTPEMVLSAREAGKSISFPRVSPDGRYLMFSASAFGYFTIHHPDSELYLMDLTTRSYRRLDEVNSDDVESFHSWSSNGRWFVFSSKRLDGVRARPFISYFDSSGKARKPFLMPQKDPDFYSTFLMSYNVPELVKGRVPFSRRLLGARATGPATQVAVAR